MTFETQNPHTRPVAEWTLSQREEVAQARIRILTGNPEYWLREYADIISCPRKDPNSRFFALLHIVASASYEHQEAENICKTEGTGLVRRWLRHRKDVSTTTIERLTPELRETALKIAQRLLDRGNRETGFSP